MLHEIERSSLDLRYEDRRLKNRVKERRLLSSIAERRIDEPLEGVSEAFVIEAEQGHDRGLGSDARRQANLRRRTLRGHAAGSQLALKTITPSA